MYVLAPPKHDDCRRRPSSASVASRCVGSRPKPCAPPHVARNSRASRTIWWGGLSELLLRPQRRGDAAVFTPPLNNIYQSGYIFSILVDLSLIEDVEKV